MEVCEVHASAVGRNLERSSRTGESSTQVRSWLIFRSVVFPHRAPGRLAFAVLLPMLLLMAACDTRNAGVISTGNTGRVTGKVVSQGQGVSVEVLLIRMDSVQSAPVDTTRSDDTGAFLFSHVASGRYCVEAWQNGKLAGQSGEFQLNGDLNGLLVVLVPLTQIQLDLSSLGTVDSVFIDNPGNPGTQSGTTWTIQGLKDSSGVLYTLVEQASGPAKWTAWNLQWVNGTVVIQGATSGSAAPFIRSVDTSAFFLTPHTVALWTFDSLTPDHRTLDLGPNHLDLTLPSPAKLVPSPHGKALEISTLPPNNPAATTATTAIGAMPTALQWESSGMQTIEMRFKLDTLPSDGFILLGSYLGPRITLTADRAVQVAMQSLTPDGTVQWQGITTLPTVIPVGQWVDIAVSITQSQEEIYIWINGTPQEIFSFGTEVQAPNYLNDTQAPFSVGGGSWDSRVGAFQVDEVRISDTLVYGPGLQLQPEFSTTIGSLGATDAGIAFPPAGQGTLDSTSPSVLVGSNTGTTAVGRYLWKPSIPATLQGHQIVFATLMLWDASNPAASQEFAVHRVLKAWTPSSLASLPLGSQDGQWVQSSPVTCGWALSGSRGGIPFDITSLVQAWVSDTASNQGILLRAYDETATGIQVATSRSDTTALNRRPSISVYYR